MVDVYVKFALILRVSGCFGLLTGEKLDPRNQYRQPKDLVTFVYQKIEGMERLLTEKDERVEKLETILTNQKTEISQLKRRMSSLEQEILHKDGIVDRLVNRVTDLEMIVMMEPIPQASESRQHQNLNRDSTTLPNDVLDQFQYPINETHEYSLRQGERFHSHSRTENLNDSAISQQVIDLTEVEPEDVPRATFSRIQHKRVAESTPTPPKQRIAFHVALSTDREYHADHTVVYDHEKLDHGNGYNPTDGVYIAPESGTYVFTWTSLCYVHQNFQTVIAVNGAYMGSSWTEAQDVSDVHQSTAVVVMTLNQGDYVLIRMGTNTGYVRILSQSDMGESTFSGWKLD